MTAAAYTAQQRDWLAGLSRRHDPARPLVVAVPAGSQGPEVFQGWHGALDSADFLTVQLPGRGARLFERPVDRMDTLADAVTGLLAPLVPRTWLLLGHCSGGYLAYEIARRLVDVANAPVRLVLSGCRPPDGLADPDSTHARAAARILAASDTELACRLRDRGRLPATGADPEVVAAVLDAYRAATRAAANYRCAPARLDVPAEVWRGLDDDTLDDRHARGWAAYLAGPPSQLTFAGVRDYAERPMDEAVERVMQLVARTGLLGGKVA